MPKLSADDLSCCVILGAAGIAQRSDGWSSCRWCRPPSQSFIAALRVLMRKAMQGLPKRERIYRETSHPTLGTTRAEVFDYLVRLHNSRMRRGSLGKIRISQLFYDRP